MLVVQVHMGNQPQPSRRRQANATLRAEGRQRRCLFPHLDIDHVGLHRLHSQAEGCQLIAEL